MILNKISLALIGKKLRTLMNNKIFYNLQIKLHNERVLLDYSKHELLTLVYRSRASVEFKQSN